MSDSDFDKITSSSMASLKLMQDDLKVKKSQTISALTAFKNSLESESLLGSCNLKKDEVVRGSVEIFYQRFFSFFKVGFFVSLFFFLSLFLANYFKQPPYFYILIIWVFSCYLRLANLMVVNNYFSVEKKVNPLIYALKKLYAFLLIELLQFVILLIGIMTVFWLPFLAARYSLALPVMVAQNDKIVNSLFESREYTKENLRNVMLVIFYQNLMSIFAMVFCVILGSFFVENAYVFWVINYLILVLIILPLQACTRFFLYKKLHKIVGEFKFLAKFFEKFWFVIWRLIFLASSFFIIEKYHESLILKVLLIFQKSLLFSKIL